MTPQGEAGVAYVAGVPPGVVVQTVQLTATVAAIDTAARKVTLVSSNGIKKVVKAGPEVINFDQIHVGDRVKVTAAEELVVLMALPNESTDNKDASLVALTSKGAKPGGVVAETRQVIGTVEKIHLTIRDASNNASGAFSASPRSPPLGSRGCHSRPSQTWHDPKNDPDNA